MVQVGKRKIDLSNLKKVLFPDDGILKAELIQYYLGLAPTILAHVKGRPLTLVRYPDGVGAETFFQKNRPKWAPDWIEYISLGDEKKKIDYILSTEEASLVWLANLACIELHQTHYRKPNYENPDYIVYDLDPPEDYAFPDVVELALEMREHLDGMGYHAFAKTTGKKGIHVITPIEPKYDFKEVFEACQAVAKSFVQARSKRTTLHIKKDSRQGKVLVDIYRNRKFQTIISPYSVRGAAGAPVSMPLDWGELAGLEDPKEWNIHTVPERVVSEGDAWEAIGAYAAELHTHRTAKSKGKKLPKSKHYKSPDQLQSYEDKREFTKTPEPAPGTLGDGDAFVVHRHHASRLHYDLRLEVDGTLKSWAVPKGLPQRSGIKRLAVHVEDHPVEYLTFEGVIPKGEYGAGNMWVFAQGRYQVTKKKKDGSFYFRLQSKELNAEYRIFPTRGKDWLLERLDKPQVDWLNDPIEYMLSNSDKKVPTSGDWIYEVKWDGIRAMVAVDEGEIRIRSRNQRDITDNFPELLIPEEAFRASSALYDTEIVCLEADGRPNFRQVINRIQQSTESGIKRAKAKHPAVCYVFDCLYLDGRPVANDPLERRRIWMADSIKKANGIYRVSEAVEDGQALFNAAKEMGLEGVMAKDPSSSYQPGKRVSTWLKIKSRDTADVVVIGYTKGKGNRETLFGALQIAQYIGDELCYRGKVGTGFDDRKFKDVLTALKKIKKAKRPVKEKPLDDAQTVWLEPKLLCEVQFASLTNRGTFREPVFVRLRHDLME